ncbi:hypothetical protein [Polycyclovorans algicola]|uniref:hypothetical protein n=1 Tax=Polycyclovorans algicola TaxID=616992 RepID=UPI0005BBD0EB|nr:hypothetical protein [Polycyclovorans algicola]
MSTWFSLEMGDGVEAFGPTGKIQEAFMPVYIAAGQPQDMAVFSSSRWGETPDGRSTKLHTVYFSPAAALLAKSFGAIPCAKPSPIGIGLLVGPQEALFSFFPDRTSGRGE